MKRYTIILLSAAFLVITAIVVSLQRVPKARAQSDATPDYQGQNSSANVFQMFYGPEARADNFLVNTATGEVWQHQQAPNGNTLFERTYVAPSPAKGARAGRYVLYFSPFARADECLLDTATGRVWQVFVDKRTSSTFFGEITVRGISTRPASY